MIPLTGVPGFLNGRVVSVVASNSETSRTAVECLRSSQTAGFSKLVLGLFVLVAGCLSLSGCGSDQPKSIPIRGKVVFKGDPLRAGEVLYSPVDKTKGRPAYGRIDENGTFVMRSTGGITGVLLGEYQIAVIAYEPETSDGNPPRTKSASIDRRARKPLVPSRYLDPSRSGLVDMVVESHSGVMNIELEP